MSRIRADQLVNRVGSGGPKFPNGIAEGFSVSGVVTATSFRGDGSQLSGISVDSTSLVDSNSTTRVQANISGAVVTGVLTATSFSGPLTGNVTGNATGLSGTPTITVQDATVQGNLTVNGTQTILNTTSLEVEDKNIGISSVSPKLSDANLDGAGITIYGSDSDKTLIWDNSNSRMAFSTDLYAPVFYGDGSQLTGISAGGLTTTASSPSANTTVTLDLSAAQHHELTLTAGITTITCSGGSFGESHSVVLIQPSSGIATVGFSTYFLFPSGSVPAMSEGSGKIDLLSFVVKRVGAGGTQLLASAGLNYQ